MRENYLFSIAQNFVGRSCTLIKFVSPKEIPCHTMSYVDMYNELENSI